MIKIKKKMNKNKSFNFAHPPDLLTIEGYFFAAEKYRLKNDSSNYDSWVYVENLLKERGLPVRFVDYYSFSVAKVKYNRIIESEIFYV